MKVEILTVDCESSYEVKLSDGTMIIVHMLKGYSLKEFMESLASLENSVWESDELNNDLYFRYVFWCPKNNSVGYLYSTASIAL